MPPMLDWFKCFVRSRLFRHFAVEISFLFIERSDSGSIPLSFILADTTCFFSLAIIYLCILLHDIISYFLFRIIIILIARPWFSYIISYSLEFSSDFQFRQWESADTFFFFFGKESVHLLPNMRINKCGSIYWDKSAFTPIHPTKRKERTRTIGK